MPGEEHDTGAPPGVLMVAKALPKGGMSGCDPLILRCKPPCPGTYLWGV